MRKILFRGKRIRPEGVDDAWAYGSLIQRIDTTEIHDGVFTWNIHPETVGQFTGLTDKNGKEIYEGDIIKEKESDYSNEYRIYRIYWCDDNMQYWMSDDDTGDSFPLIELEFDYSKVIGNIYDNPELLT